MLIRDLNIREEAYPGDELYESAQRELEHTCIVIEQTVARGTFTLQEALDSYEVSSEQYAAYRFKKLASEIRSDLGEEALNGFIFPPITSPCSGVGYWNTLPSSQSTGLEQYSNSRYVKPQGYSKIKSYFIDSLKDMLWTERYIAKEFPKLCHGVQHSLISVVLEKSAVTREGNIQGLNKIFELFDRKAATKPSSAVPGFINEAKALIKEKGQQDPVSEISAVIAARKIYHYNIASYSALADLALQMGERTAADILYQTIRCEHFNDNELKNTSSHASENTYALGA